MKMEKYRFCTLIHLRMGDVQGWNILLRTKLAFFHGMTMHAVHGA